MSHRSPSFSRRAAAAIGALIVLAAGVPAPAARASVRHTVIAGETLWSVAVRDGLSPAALAAANGLSPAAGLRAGAVIVIPPAGTSASSGPSALATGSSTTVAGEPAGDEGPLAAADPPAAVAVSTSPASAPALGGYTVRPGDTLGAIARHAGVPAAQIAFMNGLSVSGILRTGTLLKLPTGATAPRTAALPAGIAPVLPGAPPHPTPGRVSPSTIAAIAAAHGVPASLATAIAYQESGFSNAAVSSANARGVMQLLPGTWDWVSRTMSPHPPLDPFSPSDNVRAGVLYLRSLIRQTGSASLAAAAYYQGLGSIRQRGLLPETRRYVASVSALRRRFGGP